MKKTISLLLAIVMIIGLFPLESLTAFAANTATVKIESVSAIPGSTVDVAISIKDNPGIASMGFTLSFDEALTLVGATNGEAFSELAMTPPAQLKKTGSVTGSCRFAWLGSDNVTENGVILNLKFNVADNAELNKDCLISISCNKGDVLDDTRTPVDITTEDGKVTIINYTPGDVDGNSTINMLDVLTLCQFYVDGCMYDPNGYAVEINPESGDVDASGFVNMLDVLMICQFYVDGCKYDPDGYGVKLLPGKKICEHSMQHILAKDATCTEDGNIEYWHCTKCDEYFADENGNDVITLDYTVIKAKGHTVVVDEAVPATYEHTGLTEGSHCSVCKETIVVQEITPILEKDWYSITYNNLKGAETPSVQSFSKQDGLSSLPTISAEGYTFEGWYDKNDKRVDSIPAGTVENIVLYAKWKIINYSISYDLDYYMVVAVNSPENPSTYTVEDLVLLQKPSLKGYIFGGWELNGNIITEIPKGTTGNIYLISKWLPNRNVVHQETDFSIPAGIMQENNQISFAYYLGYIDNVVLDDLSDSSQTRTHDGTSSESIKYTSSTLTGENVATSNLENKTTSHAWQSSVSIGSETKFGIKAVSETVKVEMSHIQSGSSSTVTTTGDVTTTLNQITESQETTKSWSSDDAVGYYRFVNTGRIDSYAVITYDYIANKCYVSNLEVITVLGANWIYSAKSSKFDDEVEELLFDVDAVKDYLESKRIELRTPYAEKYGMTVDELDEFELYVSAEDLPIIKTNSIIDFSDVADTNINKQIYVEYGNCNEIYFVGNPEINYKNLSINLCNYPDNSNLKIHFMDFNFTTNKSYAITCTDCGDFNVTVNLVSDNSIQSSYPGGSVFELGDIADLTFVGNGNITLKGGSGADGSKSGDNGTDGGIAVICDTLTINNTGFINIYGGNGGNGADGINGADANSYDSSAYAGADAGTGGKGGDSIKVNAAVFVTQNAYLFGGNGGNGGCGGNGGNGVTYQGQGPTNAHNTPGNGGNAGNGGNGGNGGDTGLKYNLDNGSCGGQGGKGGDSGTPGTPGHFWWDPWIGDNQHWYGNSGNPGKSGNNGLTGNGAYNQ